MCGFRQQDDVSDFVFSIIVVSCFFGYFFCEIVANTMFSSSFMFDDFGGLVAKLLFGKLQKVEVFACLTFQKCSNKKRQQGLHRATGSV